MPFIALKTSIEIPAEKREGILKNLSKIISDSTGKPEQYVMAIIENSDFIMGGESAIAAFADVRGIGGINRDINAKITEKLCELLEKDLAISPNKVYVNFTDIPAANWGWNGSTFG